MFLVLLLLGTGLIATKSFVRGPRCAAAVTLALALGLPCWIYFEFGAIRIDIRTALAVAGFACVSLHSQSRVGWRWIPADAVAITLVVVQITAEYLSSDATTLSVAIDIAIQWLIPYALGRFALGSVDDVRRILPGLAVVCMVLAAWSAIESITRINPLGTLVGHVGSAQAIHDLRWGLRRAEGPHTHPIFFGLHLVLLFPFALQAAAEAQAGQGPKWWRWTPWAVAAGAFFTMSRGPQIGILITAVVMVLMLAPRWRAVVCFPIALFTLLVLGSGDAAIRFLEKWSGEESHMTILLDGELVPYSGTSHRLLQMQVYARALAASGWFGYGSTPLRAGETTIPYVEEHLRQMFSSIDNHYLQFGLQTGYLGLGSFLLLCLCGIASAATLVRHGPAELHRLGAGLTGALVALTLLMITVWLAGDYRFVLLTLLGLAGSLGSSVRRDIADFSQTDSVSFATFRLSPGYRLVAGT